MKRALLALAAALAATALVAASGRALLPATALLSPLAASDAAPGHAEPATAAPPASRIARLVPGPNAARVALTVAPAAKLAQGYALEVHLSSPDGTPLNEAAVAYYEVVDLFGERLMAVGSSRTDGQGDARLLYLPAQLGPHEIVVRAAGRGPVTPAEARMTFDAQVAASPYRSTPAPLAAFTAALPIVVGGLVLVVWALIAFAFLGTARGVLGGARDHAHEKGDLA